MRTASSSIPWGSGSWQRIPSISCLLVQLLNECNELPCVVSSGSAYSSLKKPHSSQSFRLAVYIYTAGRVVAHNNHRQARSSGQGFRCFFDFLLALLRQCLSIQNRCHSSVLLSSVFHTFFSVAHKVLPDLGGSAFYRAAGQQQPHSSRGPPFERFVFRLRKNTNCRYEAPQSIRVPGRTRLHRAKSTCRRGPNPFPQQPNQQAEAHQVPQGLI